MDWCTDMTARWVRILTAAGSGSTPLDEAARRISEIGGPSARKGLLGRRKQGADPQAEASALTALSRQLIAGVLVSDRLLDRLSALTGQTREELLEQSPDSAPQQLPENQLRSLQAELSDSSGLLQDCERASYVALGTRIERLLRTAEEQAVALVESARAEAVRITADARQPCPNCGARRPDPDA
jgi:hypothetical protein